jgi:hypothetical protein
LPCGATLGATKWGALRRICAYTGTWKPSRYPAGPHDGPLTPPKAPTAPALGKSRSRTPGARSLRPEGIGGTGQKHRKNAQRRQVFLFWRLNRASQLRRINKRDLRGAGL